MAYAKIEIRVEYDEAEIEVTQLAMETAQDFGFREDYDVVHVIGISVQEEK